MQDNIKNRASLPDKRQVGRPPNTTTPLPVEAPPVMVPDTVLPHICPLCGRGQTPTRIGKRLNGDRDVQCKLCAGKYVYTPAMVRRLS